MSIKLKASQVRSLGAAAVLPNGSVVLMVQCNITLRREDGEALVPADLGLDCKLGEDVLSDDSDSDGLSLDTGGPLLFSVNDGVELEFEVEDTTPQAEPQLAGTVERPAEEDADADDTDQTQGGEG